VFCFNFEGFCKAMPTIVIQHAWLCIAKCDVPSTNTLGYCTCRHAVNVHDLIIIIVMDGVNFEHIKRQGITF
jgi:hypothetical protein